MIYYYLLLVLLVILCFLTKSENKTRKKTAVVMIVILLTVLAGLRHYTIGNDTVIYMNSFNRITSYGVEVFDSSHFELGYNYLVLFVTSLGISFNGFLFIVSLIMNIGVGVFIYKYSKQPMFSFILFILLRLFFCEMNIVREFLAITIFLGSMRFIEERKFIKFLLMVIFASFFHSSAMFTIIIYFLYNLKLTPIKKLSFAAITAVVCIFLYNILTYVTQTLGIYEGYVDDYFGSNKLASIIMAIISVVVYLFFRIIQRKYLDKEKLLDEKQKQRLIFLGNILFFSIIFNIIAIRISIFNRLSLYYQIFNIIAIPKVIQLIPDSKKRLLWYVIIFVCFLAYFLTVLYLRPEWNMVNPYRFYWE